MSRNVEEIFGGVVVAPHQIPFTYTSTNGGETFLSLPFYPITGFVTINSGVQVPIDNFEIDGNTLNLGRELEPGDVVFCLFDKIMSPQDASNNAVRIYKFLSVGGETEFTPDFTAYGVQSLFIDGRYKVPGEDYNYSFMTGKVSLNSALPSGIWVVAEMSVKQNVTALAGNNGASNVGTESGVSVQYQLNEIDTALNLLEQYRLGLLSGTGTDYVHIGNTVLTKLLTRSIFEFMTPSDQETFLNSLGVEVVVDYALQSALDLGIKLLHWPAGLGIYTLNGDCDLPIGFSMTGERIKLYTAGSDATFNNKGTTIRLKSGASKLFKMSGRHYFSNINFDGRNKSVNFMQGDDQVTYCRFENCGFHRWLNALGNSSPSGYTATLEVSGCAISNNIRGIRNIIDSRIIDTTINANDYHGVELNTGANNNAFVNVRNEWNGQSTTTGGDNYYSYGAKRNIIVGELIDRAGYRAVSAQGGGTWTVVGSTIQRSGKNATAGDAQYDTQFYLEGSGSLIILSGCDTTSGANDDGSGRNSPTYLLTSGGSTADEKGFIASGCRLTGYTGTSWKNSPSITTLNVVGCPGISTYINDGFFQITGGIIQLGKRQTVPLSGAGNSVSMDFLTTEDAFNQYTIPMVRKLEVTARNNTATGSVAKYSVELLISRELSAASVSVDTTSVKTQVTLSGGTWGLPSASPTGVSVSFSISSDARTLTVTFTAVDNAARSISAILKGN